MTQQPIKLDDITFTAAAFRIANRAVLADIECHAVAAERLPDGRRIYDIRLMLDPREHADESIDMAREAIEYALAAGLAQPLPGRPGMLVIGPEAAA